MDLEIKPSYVQLAFNLLSCSILKVENEAIELEEDDEVAKQMIGLNIRDDQNAPNLMVSDPVNLGARVAEPPEREEKGSNENDPRRLQPDAEQRSGLIQNPLEGVLLGS